MEDSNSQGIATNTCLYCNGKWINYGSLKLILEKAENAPSIIDTKKTFQSHSDKNSNRHCPECENQRLYQVNVRGIELDLCPECNGLFFDEGELKQLLPESESSANDTGIGSCLISEGLFWIISVFLSGG
jgi:Zn-finger nucleic acid-binding protein